MLALYLLFVVCVSSNNFACISDNPSCNKAFTCSENNIPECYINISNCIVGNYTMYMFPLTSPTEFCNTNICKWILYDIGISHSYTSYSFADNEILDWTIYRNTNLGASVVVQITNYISSKEIDGFIIKRTLPEGSSATLPGDFTRRL